MSEAPATDGNACRTMLDRMLLARRIVSREFGARLMPIGPGLLLPSLRLANTLGMAVDPLLFPRLRKIRIERPILLAGAPRTGTTFLHRFLAANGVGAGTEVHRMMFPSLLAQTLMRPALPLLDAVSPTRSHPKEVHETGMRYVETDDAALLFRFFDGFLLFGFIFSWDEADLTPMFDPALRDTAARDFRYLERLWRRSLAATGRNRVIGKMFSAGPRLPSFFRHFPDARVLYTVRDPVAVVPSTLNLLATVLEERVGFWSRPEEQRQRWVNRCTAGLRELMARFHADHSEGRLPREQVMIVPFDRLKGNFGSLMDDVLDFVEHRADPALRDAIENQAAGQAQHRSAHSYDLDRFGLREERIRREFAFVYELHPEALRQVAGAASSESRRFHDLP